MSKDITVRSMVASRTGDPAVSFRLGDQHVNLPPDDARKVAIDLISAADRAEFESRLVRYLRGQGMEEREVGQMLALLPPAPLDVTTTNTLQ